MFWASLKLGFVSLIAKSASKSKYSKRTPSWPLHFPIALTEAWEQGKIKSGDLVVLAAFGSGFTWGSAIIRW